MSGPGWNVAPEHVRGEFAAWAARYGLQRTDALLPAASDRLFKGTEFIGKQKSYYEGGGDHAVMRPGRFSEGTYAGSLPGGLAGQVGHHSYLNGQLTQQSRGSRSVEYVEPLTAAVVWMPDAVRAARELRWTAADGWSAAPDGAHLRPPALDWLAPVAAQRKPDKLVVVGPGGLETLLVGGPAVVARDGYVVAEAPAYMADAEAICRALTGTASALWHAAAAMPVLAPGESLHDEAPLPDLPTLAWQRPPASTAEAGQAYLDAARDAARAGGVFGRAMKGIGVNVMHGVHSHTMQAREWGVEALARELASALGLRVTDRDDFRRRVPMPLAGHVRRCLQGPLPGGLDGHLVLWEDPTGPNGRQLLDLAIVPSRSEATPAPAAGFGAWRSGDWLVVGRDAGGSAGDAGNTVAGLDAVAFEAARLA